MGTYSPVLEERAFTVWPRRGSLHCGAQINARSIAYDEYNVVTRWVVLVALTLIGLVLLSWSIESAWLSATLIPDAERYRTRALWLFPLSLATIASGLLAFWAIGRTRRRG